MEPAQERAPCDLGSVGGVVQALHQELDEAAEAVGCGLGGHVCSIVTQQLPRYPTAFADVPL
jgi:hypothetical protein